MRPPTILLFLNALAIGRQPHRICVGGIMRAMGHPTFRAVSLLVLVTYVGACTSWQVQSAVPAQTLADPHYATKTVRLTTGQRHHVYLSHPSVTGDSVSGLRGDAPATYALTDVQEVATKRPNTRNTALLVAGTTILVGGGIAFLAWYSTVPED